MSGFHDEDVYSAERSQMSAASGTNAAAALEAGHPFSLLLAEDDRELAAALESLLDTIADPATRFARATNPLRARLTLERLLIQILPSGQEIDLSVPAKLIRAIAEQRQQETRVVLVIERAETLHPEVLRFFGATAALFPDGVPRLQVLFVGRPAFRPMLDDPDAGFDEQTALFEQYRPQEVQTSFAYQPPVEVEVQPQRPLPFIDTSLRAQVREVWNAGLLTRVTIICATLVGMGAVAFAVSLAITNPPEVAVADTSSALAELAEPAENDPDPPVLQPGPPIDASTAALRSEFEAYLTAAGKDLASASPAQRRTLYAEFLAWRSRTTGGIR